MRQVLLNTAALETNKEENLPIMALVRFYNLVLEQIGGDTDFEGHHLSMFVSKTIISDLSQTFVCWDWDLPWSLTKGRRRKKKVRRKSYK